MRAGGGRDWEGAGATINTGHHFHYRSSKTANQIERKSGSWKKNSHRQRQSKAKLTMCVYHSINHFNCSKQVTTLRPDLKEGLPGS